MLADKFEGSTRGGRIKLEKRITFVVK